MSRQMEEPNLMSKQMNSTAKQVQRSLSNALTFQDQQRLQAEFESSLLLRQEKAVSARA